MINIAYPTIIQTSKLLFNINTSPYVFQHRIIRTTVNLSKSLKSVNENSRKICSVQQLNIQNLHKYKENHYGSYSCKPYHQSIHDQFNILQNCPNIKINPLRLEFHTSINNQKETNSSNNKINNELTNEQKHENVFTIPNLLCVSRIIASPYLAHVIINNGDFSWALAIFMYAGATDAVSYISYLLINQLLKRLLYFYHKIIEIFVRKQFHFRLTVG